MKQKKKNYIRASGLSEAHRCWREVKGKESERKKNNNREGDWISIPIARIEVGRTGKYGFKKKRKAKLHNLYISV